MRGIDESSDSSEKNGSEPNREAEAEDEHGQDEPIEVQNRLEWIKRATDIAVSHLEQIRLED